MNDSMKITVSAKVDSPKSVEEATSLRVLGLNPYILVEVIRDPRIRDEVLFQVEGGGGVAGDISELGEMLIEIGSKMVKTKQEVHK